MSKSFQKQMAEARAERQAAFIAAQDAQNNNTSPLPVQQSQNNSQPSLDLNNILAALLQPGVIQNFVQQNGGTEGIANRINQFTSQNSLPNVTSQDIKRASTVLSTFDHEIEPGVKPSGEFSKHDPKKVIATKEANVRKNLAEKIKLEGFTTELKKSIAELSIEAQEKLIKYHVINFDQDKVELRDEVINFIKSGCLILNKSKGNILESVETEQIAEKSVEIKNEKEVDSSRLLFNLLIETFDATKSIEQYTDEIKLLSASEASSLIDAAFTKVPDLGGLIATIYYGD